MMYLMSIRTGHYSTTQRLPNPSIASHLTIATALGPTRTNFDL